MQGGVTMTSITYVGMDVHTTNYTVCCYDAEHDRYFGMAKLEPDYQEVVKHLNRVNTQNGGNCRFICGYEAGCLGYSLYHEMVGQGFDCIILAPSSMPVVPGKKVKTDRRDSQNIARCLAHRNYSPVYVPTDQDDAIKEYIRMRDDMAQALKRIKQQTLALCTRHGKHFSETRTKWTKAHLDWLEKLDLGNAILNETLREYLTMYYILAEKVETYDARIEELASLDANKEKVKRLVCLKGIATHTALSMCVEVGDFQRFPDAGHFAAYLGLVPGQDASGDKSKRMPITKAGNRHLRRLLIEAAQCYSRGYVPKKSKALKARQQGNSPQVIAYADRANDRLKRKYIRIALRSSSAIAKTAVARELACYVWGLMTDHIQ